MDIMQQPFEVITNAGLWERERNITKSELVVNEGVSISISKWVQLRPGDTLRKGHIP